MEALMKRIKELADEGESFGGIFCRVSGWLDSEADGKPDATRTVKEVRDLFDLLFDIKVGAYKKETPEAVISRESR